MAGAVLLDYCVAECLLEQTMQLDGGHRLWLELATLCRFYGRLAHRTQRRAMKAFTTVYMKQDWNDTRSHIYYVLPNRWPHRSDGPAVIHEYHLGGNYIPSLSIQHYFDRGRWQSRNRDIITETPAYFDEQRWIVSNNTKEHHHVLELDPAAEPPPELIEKYL